MFKLHCAVLQGTTKIYWEVIGLVLLLKYNMKSLFAKTDNYVFLVFFQKIMFFIVIMFLLFIVLVSCIFFSYFNLIQITQLQSD